MANNLKLEETNWTGWNADRPCRVTIAGNTLSITQTRNPVVRPQTKKVPGGFYLTADGEIMEPRKIKNRSEDLESVRRSLQRMRNLINCNFFGDTNELFVTLTYAENMKDAKRLYKDMEKFLKKSRRYLGEIKYLYAAEPQRRGAWHAHLLIKQLSAERSWWPGEDIAERWGHGYIWVDNLGSRKGGDPVRNVGAYLSAYLSNTPTDEEAEERRAATEGEHATPKAIEKGERLKFYPPGFHIYRASQNMERPLIKQMRPDSEEFRALTADFTVQYQSSHDLVDDRGNGRCYLINSISHQSLVRKCAAGKEQPQ